MDKILLDTTYLLPIFGVNIKLRDYEKCFPKILSKFNVLYNPISIIEAKWIVLSITRRCTKKERIKRLNRFRIGLHSLLWDRRFTPTPLTNPDVEEFADKLLIELNLKDLFDRIIYSTAKHYNAILLTEDKALLKITQSHSEYSLRAVNWESLVRNL